MFDSGVSASHREAKAAEWNPAITQFIICTCGAEMSPGKKTSDWFKTLETKPPELLLAVKN